MFSSLSLDRYETRESVVHRLDPRVKVVVTLLFVLSNVLLPDGAWGAFGLAWVGILLVSAASHLGWGYTLKRSFVALPFALTAVTLLFSLPGEPLLSVKIGSTLLVISDAGLVRFASVVIRSWLSVQMAILLVATTQFPDLMHAFHHLRLPQPFIAIISFMYRYLFVLAEETSRLLRARESRSAAGMGNGRSGGSVWWRARVAGYLIGQLFIRSYERSDRIYQAMLARGYHGEWLTINPHTMKQLDWLVLGGSLLVISFIQLIGRM